MLPLAGYAAADHLGGVARKDGVRLVEGAVQTAHGPDGGVGREACAFGDDDVAAEPHMVGKDDGSVRVAAVAVRAEEGVLVSVHHGAAPGGLHMGAEGDGVVADNERRGAEVEIVAKGEGAGLRHFDARARTDGALAKDVEGAPEVKKSAVMAEIGLLAGVKTYLDKPDAELRGVEDQTA